MSGQGFNRLSGDLRRRVLERALLAFMPKSGSFSGWAGGAGQIGIEEPRILWRLRMEAALEAAFEELLRDPSATPIPDGAGREGP